MSGILIVFIILIASISFAASTAQKTHSLPEFECTLVKIINKHAAKELFGVKKQNSLSLRSTSKNWYFDMGLSSYVFETNEVQKKSNYVLNQQDYLINFKNRQKLSLFLKGKSPRRSGELRLINGDTEVLIGLVTCH